MTNRIHPTAVIDPTAILGDNIEVGPYSVVGPDAKIGDNTIIAAHVVVEARSIIGQSCQISPGAVLGGPPQDLSYKGEPTRVRIGDSTVIRECVTVNRATGEDKETVVGSNCMLMAYSHVAHNCLLGDNVILANTVQLGGHVQVGDYAFIGGASVIHQHVRIGKMAIMGGASASRQDIPPFAMADGRAAHIQGINSVGLRRRGLTSAERQNLKKAFFYLWFGGLNQSQAIATIRENLTVDAYIEELITFVQTSKRGIKSKADENTGIKAEDSELDNEPVSIT